MGNLGCHHGWNYKHDMELYPAGPGRAAPFTN